MLGYMLYLLAFMFGSSPCEASAEGRQMAALHSPKPKTQNLDTVDVQSLWEFATFYSMNAAIRRHVQ
jgi:hypothetical protein